MSTVTECWIHSNPPCREKCCPISDSFRGIQYSSLPVGSVYSLVTFDVQTHKNGFAKVSTSAIDHELYLVEVKRSNVSPGIGGECRVAGTRCVAEKSKKNK
jgi:hypothetical protein